MDFGINKGGTLIDLIMRIDKCSEKQALDTINQYVNTSVQQYDNTTAKEISSFSFHGNSPFSIQEIKSITHLALLNFLEERCVDIDIAKQHCKEIHYTVNDKPYFAIGFENNSGGYALRNKHFKGCTSNDYTFQNTGSDICLVFEGFMDYLSYLTLRNIHIPNQNIIVLNSVTNLPKAIDLLKGYKEIPTYLDNDEAGKKATLSIRQICTNVTDQSVYYANHKDLNEYLISTRQVQQKLKPAIEVKRKPSRGFRM